MSCDLIEMSPGGDWVIRGVKIEERMQGSFLSILHVGFDISTTFPTSQGHYVQFRKNTDGTVNISTGNHCSVVLSQSDVREIIAWVGELKSLADKARIFERFLRDLKPGLYDIQQTLIEASCFATCVGSGQLRLDPASLSRISASLTQIRGMLGQAFMELDSIQEMIKS